MPRTVPWQPSLNNGNWGYFKYDENCIVAEGEEKYIYPFIDSSDLIWNSSLDYEVSVLYPFVYPLLRTVDVRDPNYYLASYLMDTMSHYLPISDYMIEKTALLREFIGGGTFE